MDRKTFFTLNALMFIPFGLGMLLMPSPIFAMIDVLLDSDGLLMASTVGSMLLSFGVICLMARGDTGNSVAMQAVLAGNLLFHTIDSLLTLNSTVTGVMNTLGSMFSGMHLLFAIGFLYFLLKARKELTVNAAQVQG